MMKELVVIVCAMALQLGLMFVGFRRQHPAVFGCIALAVGVFLVPLTQLAFGEIHLSPLLIPVGLVLFVLSLISEDKKHLDNSFLRKGNPLLPQTKMSDRQRLFWKIFIFLAISAVLFRRSNCLVEHIRQFLLRTD